MIIPLGMIRATQKNGYGRTVEILINPLQVVGIISHCNSTIVYLSNGKHFEARESSETLEKAWTNIMKHAVEEPELEDPS